MTLCQAFVIAGALGGYFGKLEDSLLKVGFIVCTMALFIVGIVFADNPFEKKGAE